MENRNSVERSTRSNPAEFPAAEDPEVILRDARQAEAHAAEDSYAKAATTVPAETHDATDPARLAAESMRRLMQGDGTQEREVVDGVKTTEVDSGEMVQALVEAQGATVTVSGGVTLDEVKSVIDTRMRQVKEQQNDAICAAVEDTFVEALTMTVADLLEGHVGTGLYQVVENVGTKILDDSRICDTITDAAAETVCSATNIDRIAKRLATVFLIRSR